MDTILLIIVVVSGLIVGSFFNVLIYRLPLHASLIRPASHCPKCNRLVRPWENIPLVSYILLRGRCAGCRQPISPQYPLVEGATALAALVLWKTVATPLSPLLTHDIVIGLQCGALLLMVPIAVIDMRHYIIPDMVTVSLLVAALLASFLPGDSTPLQSLIGAAVGGVTLLCLGWLGTILFRKDAAMGGGDIKLMAAVGALWGYKIVLLTFFFGSCLGTIGAGALFFAGRLNKDHRIPFGPFLAAGLWIAVLAGDSILRGYLRLFF